MTFDLVLTSRYIQSGRLIRNRELVLLINGLNYDEYLSNNIRVECLKKAAADFDQILETVAGRFHDHQYGSYLWIYTPDFIRSEDILDLYRRLYLKSIIKSLAANNQISKLSIEVPISRVEKNFFRQIVLNVKVKRVNLLKNRILILFTQCKALFKLGKRNCKYLLSKSNESFTGSLIDTSTRFHKSRYDDLLKVENIFQNNFKYFSGEQMPVRGADRKYVIEFKRELNCRIFFESLQKAFKVYRFILSNKSQIPHELYFNHRGLYKFLLYWDLIISQKCIDKFLSISRISHIVQVSTLTKPIYRSLVASARKYGISFIQVASRTLMMTRCSERLLKCDIDEVNNTAIPDYFIVKDQYSRKVFDAYPELSERVLIGGRFKPVNVNNLKKERNFAILILLNHRRDVSDKILRIVLETRIYKKIDNIFFRCHPSTTYGEIEIKMCFPENEIKDISGKSYDEILKYNIIAITGATTASLEAVQYGAVLFWLPFIWDDSILFDDLMNEMGVKCENQKMLEDTVVQFIEKPDFFKKKLEKDTQFCKENIFPEHLISEQISAILKKI